MFILNGWIFHLGDDDTTLQDRFTHVCGEREKGAKAIRSFLNFSFVFITLYNHVSKILFSIFPSLTTVFSKYSPYISLHL
jgi:hypothetical protein